MKPAPGRPVTVADELLHLARLQERLARVLRTLAEASGSAPLWPAKRKAVRKGRAA